MNPAVAAMLLTQAIWGFAPVAVRFLSISLGPADSLILRYGLVSLAYLPLLLASGRWRVARQDWRRLAMCGATGVFCYNLGSSFGFAHVGAGLGSLIIGTQPILIALFAAMVGEEKIRPATVAGIVIAFCGTLILFAPDLAAGEMGTLKGALMIFGSSICWALYTLTSRPLIRKYGSLTISGWTTLLGSPPLLMLLWHEETILRIGAMTGMQWLAMLYMAALSTFLASMTWNFASARLPAAVSGAFLYLVPVIAVISGALTLGEPITPAILGGGLMVLAGVSLAQNGPVLLKRLITRGNENT